MGLSKKIELGFRRTLLRMLKFMGRRRPSAPRSDYDKCKFLFIRQDRIGDVLVSTPLLASLKKHYPGAVIDVLLSSNNHFVLENEPAVRKRWVYDKKLLSSLRVLSGMRAERYDFVIDLMDNPSATSTVILLLAGGKWNVGLEKDNQYAYDIVVPMLSRKETHIVDRLAQLLNAFGIASEREDLNIRYQTKNRSDDTVRLFLEQHCQQTKRLIGVNISAGNDSRFWGIEQYRALLREINRRRKDVITILLFKPADQNRAMQIADETPGVVLAPTLSFDEFAAMIKRLWLLITPDTSAVHLAAAFRVPSVILYVQSDTTLRIWEPYRTPFEPVITTGGNLAGLGVPQVVEAIEKMTGRLSRVSAKPQSRSEHA